MNTIKTKTTHQPTSIGIIAGSGDLPILILQQFLIQANIKKKINEEVLTDKASPTKMITRPIIAIAQIAPNPALEKFLIHSKDVVISHAHFSWGSVGKMIDYFNQLHLHDLVLAGGLKRPSIRELMNLKLDTLSKIWLKRLGKSLLQGDNHLLEQVHQLIHEEGFRLYSSKDFLNQQPKKSGVLTYLHPTIADYHSIKRGQEVLKALSPLDIGQAVVVARDIVLAIEAAEGTAGLILRCCDLNTNTSEGDNGPYGVLIKGCKINQSMISDLPTIGPDTIKQLASSQLRGIAFDLHGQILHQEETIELANNFGIFITLYDHKET